MDISAWGWGAHLDRSGFLDQRRGPKVIKLFGTEGHLSRTPVFLTIGGPHVQVLSDNTIAVAYVLKQGGASDS